MAKATILIIEDNELNAKLVRCLLEVGGYRVLEALDAETGIVLTRRHHPDLVLMDIQLSGMDGLSATRLMKQEPSLKSIPVVADLGVAWPIIALRLEQKLGISLDFISYPQQSPEGQQMRKWIVENVQPIVKKKLFQ